MNTKNFVRLCFACTTLASSAVMFAANPVQAAIFNVNGTDYDITTVTGTYDMMIWNGSAFVTNDSLSSLLESQIWWGNELLATELAAAVGGSLGGQVDHTYLTSYSYGPAFAYNALLNPYGPNYSGEHYVSGKIQNMWLSSIAPYNFDLSGFQPVTFAVASTPASVPEPLTILGSITAAGFGIAFKRKKNEKAK